LLSRLLFRSAALSGNVETIVAHDGSRKDNPLRFMRQRRMSFHAYPSPYNLIFMHHLNISHGFSFGFALPACAPS
jgi:hypothetical protein